jgi:hypothetical protein
MGLSFGQEFSEIDKAWMLPYFATQNCQRHSSQSKAPELDNANLSSHQIESSRRKNRGLKGENGNEECPDAVSTAGLKLPLVLMCWRNREWAEAESTPRLLRGNRTTFSVWANSLARLIYALGFCWAEFLTCSKCRDRDEFEEVAECNWDTLSKRLWCWADAGSVVVVITSDKGPNKTIDPWIFQY